MKAGSERRQYFILRFFFIKVGHRNKSADFLDNWNNSAQIREPEQIHCDIGINTIVNPL